MRDEKINPLYQDTHITWNIKVYNYYHCSIKIIIFRIILLKMKPINSLCTCGTVSTKIVIIYNPSASNLNSSGTSPNN